MDTTIPASFASLLLVFSWVFTEPSFQNFVCFITGAISCPGRHTISRIFQAGVGPARQKHHAAFYRFLSRAEWSVDALGQVLFGVLRPFLPEEIVAAVDDTLAHRSGPHLWGAGMHHDASRSTYGRGSGLGRRVALAFGHNWVVLSLWVPLPWNPDKGLAVPILFRLYRAKKHCPPGQYRKRTDLAAELLTLLAQWVGPQGHLLLLSDHEYACHTLLQDLPPWVTFIGPMGIKAALYAPPGPYPGRGRPPKRGPRLPSPQALAQDPTLPWQAITVGIYGYEKVTIQIKTQLCLWYSVTGSRLVRMIVTRDPAGQLEDRAYFATDPQRTPEAIVVVFSRRWPLETCFRNAKQLMGLEDPQNGWGRRPAGRRPRPKRPGPQPRGRRGQHAVERTVPMLFMAYGLVIVWYFRHGRPAREVKTVQQQLPWYQHKCEPSFGDMLAALRREFWLVRFSQYPLLRPVAKKIAQVLPYWLLAA